MDLNKKTFTTEFKGRPLTLEVSRLAEQANASVVAKYGETVVLATAVMMKEDRGDIDYLPLMVDYEQKFYAIGKILGSRFARREGRAADSAVLRGRLIDRTIRPLFDHRMRRDIQVVVTVLQYDGENDHTFLGLVAASTALAISDIPWGGPVAGVNVAQIGGKIVVSPKDNELKEPTFESFVAGTTDFINMIELEGREAVEEDIARGFEEAHAEIKNLIAFQNKIVKEIGKPKSEVKLAEPDGDLAKKIKSFISGKLEGAIYVQDKTERQNNLDKIKNDLKEHLKSAGTPEAGLMAADVLLESEIDGVVHENIIKKDKRPDGRKLNEVRELYAETHLFSRLHGSALFVRGNTQALAITTLGSPEDGQLVEAMDFNGTKNFLLHYNFPNYSVGEIGSFRGPGRREIGHGNLAEKALRNLIPSKDVFPYTIRVVSEILSSTGSSSMATVCASSMSMMDAGVPIKKPAAGIAMGLMSDASGNYKILTDIQGPEDHYGDMDFKVAGTDAGVTAVQLDVKINGLNIKMVRETLAQAREARAHILGVMAIAIAAPRKELSPFAPIILSTTINPEAIGLVVGPGGKTIHSLIEHFKITDIQIEQTGKVFVTSPKVESAREVIREIELLTKEFQVGDIVEGEIIKILDFGAIMDLGGGMDGMIHVSELKDGFVKQVTDVVKLGDHVRAKVVRVEEGRIGLSLKAMKE